MTSTKVEFSRLLTVDKIPPGGKTEDLKANATECENLAERFGLLKLPKLTANLTLTTQGGAKTVEVRGILEADVLQQCVVTLEPVENHIECNIEALYMPLELAGDGAGSPDPNDPDIEVIIDGQIDLGELCAQHLGIALDPYPRKPGLDFVKAEYGDNTAPLGPLAQLANWTKKPKE